MCADSFFSAFFVLKHSPSRKLYICLKIISLLDKLSSRLNRVKLRLPAVMNAMMDSGLSSVDCVWISWFLIVVVILW